MPRISRAESQKITRNKLCKAALTEFAMHGIPGAKVDQITLKAGYSRGAFYANYASKEAIALEILNREVGNELRAWDEIEPSADLLSWLPERITNFLANKEWRLFQAEVQMHANRNPEFGESYLIYLEKINLKISGLLQAWFDQAGREPPTNTLSIAILYRDTISGLSIDPSPSISSEHDLTDLVVLMMRGLLSLGKPVN